MRTKTKMIVSEEEKVPLIRSKLTQRVSSRVDTPPPPPRVLPATLCWTTNLLALTNVFFFSGIIFGWAPLERMLLKEGQYANLCSSSSSNRADTGANANANDALCAAQTNALHGMFTLGQFFLSLASLPVGIALDYSPKPFLLGLCGILEVSGLSLLAVSDTAKGVDYFYVAYALLALGGCISMLTAFPASFLLPRHQAAILASISCLFDSSSIVFFLFEQAQSQWNVSRQDLLLGYGLWAALSYASLAACWYQLELKNWQSTLEHQQEQPEQHDDDDDDDESKEKHTATIAQSNNNNIADQSRLPSIQDMPLTQQLQTYEFALAVIFASTHMLRCNYFIMTVEAMTQSMTLQLQKKTTMTMKKLYTPAAVVFSWILPMGVVFVPLIERTITQWGVFRTLQLVNLIGIGFGILVWIPMYWVQIANFILFTCFRAYLYSTLNALVAETFGVTTMGRIIGCIFTTAAVVSLIQYPLAVLSETLHDYWPVNVLLVVVCALPVVVVFGYSHKPPRSSGSNTNNNDQCLDTSASSALLLGSPGRGVIDSVRERRRVIQQDSERSRSSGLYGGLNT